MRDDGHAFQRRRLLLPFLHRRIPACREILAARLVVRRVGARRSSLRRFDQCIRDLRDVARVLLDVRIAGGMHVAFAAIDARRHFQASHIIAGLEVAGLSGRDLRIARLLQQNRQPAHLQFQSGA